MTHGEPLLSLILNVVVNGVVREWLHRTLDKDTAWDGLMMEQSTTGMISLYVDDSVLSVRDPVWLQNSFNVLINLFDCIDLKTNTKKMQVMTCAPGKIRESMSKEVYHNSRLGPMSSTDQKCL